MTIGSQPAILWIWYYWQVFPIHDLFFYILFPLLFFIAILLLIFGSTIVSRIILSFVNLIHKPKEGVFDRNKKDKDYCYWSLRSVIKKWPIWLARQLSLPFIETLVAKILGLKTSFTSSLNEGWVDCELVKCGKNVRLGQGSIIMSNILIKDKLILKKILIGDNVIIGAHSVILPGTIIEENTIVDSITMTAVNQILKTNSTYSGQPARKIDNDGDETDLEPLKAEIFDNKIQKEYDYGNLISHAKELSVPFHLYISSGFLIIGGSFILPGFLFIFYVYLFLVPNLLTIPFSLGLLLNLETLLYMFLTPLIFICVYLLHLFFVALFTRWFYRYADKRAPSQGVFDRNLDSASTELDFYHFRSFLLKYPVFAFIRSPFPWLINWELRFIGSNKIGKGTTLEECYIHSHINYGKNCYAGTFSHISNHLVDGVYGSENLTFWGAETADNSVYNALIGAMPGLEMGEGSTMLPLSTSIKYDKLGDNGIFAGFPTRKLKTEDIKKILGGEYDVE